MLDPGASNGDNTGDSKPDGSASSPSISSPLELASDASLAPEEILWLIFQFAEPASLAVAARVCRHWSGTALDELWRSLPSIYPLLTLLVPRIWILDATEYRKNLLDSLVKADWDRFRGYAARIRSVRVDHDEKANLPLESVALIQAFHGPSPIMPNIKTISWRFFENKNFASILPFISHQLENLDLTTVKGIDIAERSQLLQGLAHRAPNLRSLRLLSFTKVRHMNIPLAALISSSPKLVYLKLPTFFLTKEVVAAAAKLPFLTKLLYSTWPEAQNIYHGSGMYFEFTPDSFPQLDDLAFAALPTRMAKVLDATDHVGRLRRVYLDCPAYYSSQEIETVFAKLGDGGKCLETVQLMCCPVQPLASSSSNDSLSIDTIRPLFSCTQLGSLHLWGPHFVPLNEEDIFEMGQNWPLMHSLNLCSTPLVEREQGTSFHLLAAFAKGFPHLRILRLFFSKEIPVFDGDLYPVSQFKGLDILGVGWSPVPEGKAQEMGFLLASLCQHIPLIQYGILENDRGNNITEEERTRLAAGWFEVKTSVDLVFRVKSSFIRKYGRMVESNAELGQEAS